MRRRGIARHRPLTPSLPPHHTVAVRTGRVRISVLVDVPRGHSRLLVKIDPPPTSVADAVLLSAPQAERASGQPVLHAQLLSPDPGF